MIVVHEQCLEINKQASNYRKMIFTIITRVLLVSSLGTWAEEERESKSLRGVFPFSHVQQQNIAHSAHNNHNANHRNPIASQVHNLNHENRNSHSNTHHQPDVFHTHQESQSDGYYVSKVNGANVKSSSEFPTISKTDQLHDAHHESGNDDYYISKVDGVSTKVSPEFQSKHFVDPYQSENTDSVRAIPNRESRQGGGDRDGFGEDIFIDLEAVAAAGERCIDKVVIVEETRYDDVIECKHSYTEKCHTTYVTDFKPQQEEVCEENFVKNCFIEYKNIASEDTVKFCHTPLECVGEGPEECKTVYESECQTNYHEHDVEDDIVNCETIQEEKCEDVTQGYSTERKCTKWPVQKCNGIEKKKVKKYSPETNCRKVPRQLCGPSGCELSPGPEFCFDKLETVIQEVPEETCHLEPQRSCKHVTKLVPVLKPAEECVDIPKEVCSRSRTNPRKERIPIVKKWCYVPTEESGLLPSTEEYS